MTDLDPEEERLITEAMLETAGEDLSGPAFEFVEDTYEKTTEDNVPKSKVQFPIRRRNSSRNRKIFCVATFLVLVFGALVATYFILKTKTFSFELKLQKGHVMHYRLTQESNYEGIKQVHTNFAEDVFVEIVNKTGNRCWMKVSLKTLPNSKTQSSNFLVSVNLGGQDSINIEGKRRLKIFTRNNHNRSVDYYTWNLLTQLFPVVKIDLFEVILSQITTRKHEVTIQDSKFFPGKVTMKQNIRMSKEHVLVTSRVDPEGFAAFSSSKSTNLLPDVAFTFEEDTAISKDTGMIETSNMELSAKIPLHGDLQQESPSKTLVMRFKSSLRLIKEQSSTTFQNKPESTHPFVEMPEVSTPPKVALQYLSPSYKKYDENVNVVVKVKELLNITRIHGSDGYKHKTSKDMEEFAKSFHKIVKPGVETNFAEDETNGTKSDALPVREVVNLQKTSSEKNSQNRHESFDGQDDDDNDDNYSNDNDAPLYDDDERDDDDDDHGRRWNRFGQAVPTSPDEDDSNDDGNYNGPTEHDASRASRKHKHDPRQDVNHDRTRLDGNLNKKLNVAKVSDSVQERNKHKGAETHRFTELNQESKKQSSKKVTKTSKMSKQATKHQKDDPKKKSKLNERNKDKITNIASETVDTPAPQQHEHTFFDGIFDRLRNDDNDDDNNDDEKENGFKFSNLAPFSFSSNFPFVHFRWPRFNSRKRRSLEPNEEQKVHRDVIHRDKRDVIHRDKRDVIHQGKRDVIHRGKRDVIHRDKRDVIHRGTDEVLHRFKRGVFHRNKSDVIHRDKDKVLHRFKRDVIHRDKDKVLRRFKRDVIHRDKDKVLHRFKRDVIHRDKRRLYDDDDDDYSSRDLESVMDVISPGSIKQHPKQTSQVFHRMIMGLAVNAELEHEVKVSTGSSGDNNAGWVIRLSLLLSVDKHKFKVLHKTISMKEIEERFVKNSKPKYEYGTVHAGTMVLCARLHYIENICVELQLGFVLHVSHTIDNLSKEYPIELSIFFKHLAKVDVTLSSHMTSLLGSHGVYGQGALFGAKIPLEVKFSELKNTAQWCTVANLKSKVGHFYENWKDLSQWSCSIDKAVEAGTICKGLNKNSTHKSSRKLWYRGASTTKLHFLNNC